MGTVGISLLIGTMILAAILCAAFTAGFGLAAGLSAWRRALASMRRYRAERAMRKNVNAIVEGAKGLCRQNAKGK